MVKYEDMTPDERDRFVYLMLGENDLKAIVTIMRKKHGASVSTEDILRFAFKVAQNKMVPKKIREMLKNKKSANTIKDIPDTAKIFSKIFKNQ